MKKVILTAIFFMATTGSFLNAGISKAPLNEDKQDLCYDLGVLIVNWHNQDGSMDSETQHRLHGIVYDNCMKSQ